MSFGSTWRARVVLLTLPSLGVGCANKLDVDGIPLPGRAWSSAVLVVDLGGEVGIQQQVAVSSQLGVCRKSRRFYEDLAELSAEYEALYGVEEFEDDEALCQATWDWMGEWAKLVRRRYPGDSWELSLWPMDHDRFPQEQAYSTDAAEDNEAFDGRLEIQPEYSWWDLIADVRPNVSCEDDDLNEYYAYDNGELYTQYLEATELRDEWGSWVLSGGQLELSSVSEDRIEGTLTAELLPLTEGRDDASLEASFGADRCDIDATELGELVPLVRL